MLRSFFMAYKDIILADSPFLYHQWATSTATPTNQGSGSVSISAGSLTTATGVGGTDFSGVWNGSTSYVRDAITGTPFNSGTWSVELWFKRANTTDSGYMELFNIYNGSNQIAIYGSANNQTIELWYNFNGGTRQKVIGPTITDTKWHHVVAVSNGTDVRLYVDGVEVGARGTALTGSFVSGDILWLGAYGNSTANENWNGNIDEVATYTTALSATKVQQRYNAINGATYNAQAMTGSGTAPDATGGPYDYNGVVVADSPVTRYKFGETTGNFYNSGTLGGSSYVVAGTNTARVTGLPGMRGDGAAQSNIGNYVASAASHDYTLYNSGGIWSLEFWFKATDATTDLVRSTGVPAWKVALNAGIPEFTYGSFTVNAGGAMVNDGQWHHLVLVVNPSTQVIYIDGVPRINASNAFGPITGGGQIYLGSTTASQSITMDELAFYDQAITGSRVVEHYNNSGLARIALANGGAATGSGLMTNPTLSFASHKTVNAPVATGNGMFVDSGVNGTGPITIIAGVTSAYGEFANPALSLVRNPTLAVGALEGSGIMPGGGFQVPIVVAAGAPATASGYSVDPFVKGELNAIPKAAAATGFTVAPSPSLIINDSPVDIEAAADLYRAQMVKTIIGPDFWYRLDEQSGTVAKDARGDSTRDADFAGNFSFDVFGPEARRAVHFENGYMVRRWANDSITALPGQSHYDDVDASTWSFETVIRTTDKNGILAFGLDKANPTNPLGAVPYFRNAISLQDGKVSLNWNYRDRTDSQFSLNGFKDVADGQWHHIVVSFNQGSELDLNAGIRIMIDGKLDIRRRFGPSAPSTPGIWAAPDSYFGMPEVWRQEGFLFPWQDNLTADVMEVAFRVGHDVTNDQTIDLYYAAFGIVPIRVTPAVGLGVMPDAKGKGNRKVALVLYTKWNGAGNLIAEAGYERNAPSGYSTTVPDEFDHPIAIGRVKEPGEGPQMYGGYLVESVPIMREDGIWQGDNRGPYRDDVTDLPRLINLQTDLNLDRYDVIMFRNWPDEGADQNIWWSRGYTRAAVENFLASVKKAVVDGKSLEITNPSLAQSLGLISNAAPVPMLWDKAADGYSQRDDRAAIINPWGNSDRYASFGDKYLDIHANNMHRVTALITDLTDIEGDATLPVEYIKEAFMQYNNNMDLKNLVDVNLKFGYKSDAYSLSLGSTFFDIAGFVNKMDAWQNPIPVTQSPQWEKYVWAITPDGLNVGTPVYKFGARHYKGAVEVDNPYAEYIGGAVVEPGDNWGGTRIAGKVWMNFAENPQLSGSPIVLSRQLVPPNDQISNFWDWEDAEKRDWDYSYIGRTVSTNIGNTINAMDAYNMAPKFSSYSLSWTKGGKPKVTTNSSDAYRGGGTAEGLTPQIVFEKYPTVPVLFLSWTVRGLAWLGVTEEVVPGSVNIRPTSAQSLPSTMINPGLRVEFSNTVKVEPASSKARMLDPAEVDDPNVDVDAFPMTGSGRMGGFGNAIYVEPAEGSGVLVDTQSKSDVYGQATVYLMSTDSQITLYLLEGKN